MLECFCSCFRLWLKFGYTWVILSILSNSSNQIKSLYFEKNLVCDGCCKEKYYFRSWPSETPTLDDNFVQMPAWLVSLRIVPDFYSVNVTNFFEQTNVKNRDSSTWKVLPMILIQFYATLFWKTVPCLLASYRLSSTFLLGFGGGGAEPRALRRDHPLLQKGQFSITYQLFTD